MRRDEEYLCKESYCTENVSKKYNEFILHVANTSSIQRWQRTITSNDRWGANLWASSVWIAPYVPTCINETCERRGSDDRSQALVKEKVRWCVGVVIRWRQTAALQTRKVSKEQRAPETACASYIMGYVFKTYACTRYSVCRLPLRMSVGNSRLKILCELE